MEFTQKKRFKTVKTVKTINSKRSRRPLVGGAARFFNGENRRRWRRRANKTRIDVIYSKYSTI